CSPSSTATAVPRLASRASSTSLGQLASLAGSTMGPNEQPVCRPAGSQATGIDVGRRGHSRRAVFARLRPVASSARPPALPTAVCSRVMDCWEYRTLTIESHSTAEGSFDVDWIDSVLNALGREGWELVVALDPNTVSKASREIVMVFKRKRA